MKKLTLTSIILATVLGFLIQRFTLFSGGRYYEGFFNEYLGFTLLLPIAIGLLFMFINYKKIKNKILITIVSSCLCTIMGIINVYLYSLTGGRTGPWFEIAYIVIIPPSFIFGFIFGLIVSYTKKSN